MVNIKIYLINARRELAHIKIELANKKIKNIKHKTPTFIIITLPPQITFINSIKADRLTKLSDTPKYINKRDNLKP